MIYQHFIWHDNGLNKRAQSGLGTHGTISMHLGGLCPHPARFQAWGRRFWGLKCVANTLGEMFFSVVQYSKIIFLKQTVSETEGTCLYSTGLPVEYLTGWKSFGTEKGQRLCKNHRVCGGGLDRASDGEGGFPGGSEEKKPPANVGDTGLIPGLGRSPGEGNSNPLQYSCLGNPLNRRDWWATAHVVAKNRTRLGD